MKRYIKKIMVSMFYFFRPLIGGILFLLPIKKNKIVFDNFMGKGYGDNPKYIAEEMMRRKLKWDMVWVANEVCDMPSAIRTVKYDSLKAMYEMSTAKVWVDNVRNTYRPPKKKRQVYLQTWHGSYPSKKIEGQEGRLSDSYIKRAQKDGKICDAIITGNSFCGEIMKESFWLNEKTELLNVCEPKSDILFDVCYLERTSKKVRAALNIAEEEFVVLYAPTFRESINKDGYIQDFVRITETIEKQIAKKTKVLLRYHPNEKDRKIVGDVIECTNWNDINELYSISDLLITDYSSVGFEFFSILKRPVILFMSDIENYSKERDLSELYSCCNFPKAFSLEELVEILSDSKTYSADGILEGVEVYTPGCGARNCVDWILSRSKLKN